MGKHSSGIRQVTDKEIEEEMIKEKPPNPKRERQEKRGIIEVRLIKDSENSATVRVKFQDLEQHLSRHMVQDIEDIVVEEISEFIVSRVKKAIENSFNKV